MENKTANAIGVFDSGLGGLTVLKSFLEELPEYGYIYLGDNARVPYGEKSPETIYTYAREAMDFLFSSGCNLVIIACNTATSQALRRLQQEYLPAKYPRRRILGVIRPLAENIAADGKSGTVGVIGTLATIRSDAYRTEIKKLKPETEIFQTGTPLLVPLIENGWAEKPETKMILKKYLRPLKEKKIDSLILGCTHYPFLQKEIEKIMGRRIHVPEPGKIIAQSLKDYLARHPELGLSPSKNPGCRIYATDQNETFRRLGERFLGRRIEKLEPARITTN